VEVAVKDATFWRSPGCPRSVLAVVDKAILDLVSPASRGGGCHQHASHESGFLAGGFVGCTRSCCIACQGCSRPFR